MILGWAIIGTKRRRFFLCGEHRAHSVRRFSRVTSHLHRRPANRWICSRSRVRWRRGGGMWRRRSSRGVWHRPVLCRSSTPDGRHAGAAAMATVRGEPSPVNDCRRSTSCASELRHYPADRSLPSFRARAGPFDRTFFVCST